jgi:hypothetical protein
MASHEELTSFVKDALGRGVARVQLEEALRRAGWRSEQIHGALAAYADIDFPIPVPRPKPLLSAREAFLYLVLFSTLYVTAWNVGSLLFEMIDRAFPDPAVSTNAFGAIYVREAIRWAVSSLIVAFPVFLSVSWFVAREIRRDPTKRASPVRRWLTYLTLFIAAGVLVGDVIALVYNVLGGELTTRFVLKVLSVGMIAGTTFWYYLSDLRPEEREPRT